MAITLNEAYRLLGIPENSTEIEVRKAYKRLALRYHPDKSKLKKDEATKRFQQISTAYKRITDPVVETDENNDHYSDNFTSNDLSEMMEMFNLMMSIFESDHLYNNISEYSSDEELLDFSFKKLNFNEKVNYDIFQVSSSESTQDSNDELNENGFYSDLDMIILEQIFTKVSKNKSKKKFNCSKSSINSTILNNNNNNKQLESNVTTKSIKIKQVITRDESEKQNSSIRRTIQPKNIKKLIDDWEIGDPVLVYRKHEGIIAYIGLVHYGKGTFVGVILNEKNGKNDGIIKGRKYFSCEPGHGLMVRFEDITQICK